MHLDLGGSDLEASQATSAVNESNTLEPAGGSPYASTSASDRVQSSLKEPNVSTDPGMYSLQNL